MSGVLGKAPARRQPGDVEALFDGYRDAEERAVVGTGVVKRLGGGTGAIEIAHHDRVDVRVARLDPRDRRVGFGQRSGFTRSNRGGGGEGGARDRKSTRLNSITNAHHVCRLLLE